MVVGTEQRNSGIESEEFIIPEFGRVNLSWFDLSKRYRGAIFRLAAETAKQVAEIVGFCANFDLPGIRTACVDLVGTQGYCVFEIERNTKPTDIAVRYSRERWNLVEASGKSGDTLRPWIKTEYQARFISEKVVALVAEQLKIVPDNSGNFIMRLNFKERTFGLICDERFVEQMPSGGFSAFGLPTAAMLALAENLQQIESRVDEIQSEDEMEEAEMNYPEPEEDISTQPAGDNTQQGEQSPSTLTPAQEPLPGSTEALEKFIQRKADRPVETPVRREPVETTAKYATYSRSEVDQMLKQQTENVAAALGSKISSQQRIFQEAVERQEKSFAKLSDSFVVQFDQTRSRLENQSKLSEETIRNELDSFKKELGKELEQFRAQINKTVVPVAKFIEEKNTKPAEKATKEVARAQKEVAKSTPQSSGDVYGLRPLLITNLVLVLVALGALFAVVMPDLERITQLQNKIDQLNSKLNPSTSSGAGPSSTTGSSNSGNLNRTSDTDTPVSSSGN